MSHKTILIIISVINALAVIGLIGYLYLLGLGRSWSTSSYNSPIGYEVQIPVILLTACISFVLAYIDRPRGFIWLLLPWIVIPLFFYTAKQKNDKAYIKYSEERQQIEQQKKDQANMISKDYSDKGEDYSISDRSVFLHYDKNNNVIVRIFLSYGAFSDAQPFGKINGKTLQVFDSSLLIKESGTEYYRVFTNKDGKSVFDLYTVTYVPDQNISDYHLEQYK